MAEIGNGSILSYIKLYRENNISFFPLFPRTKTPVVKHAEYYNRLPSEQEIKVWLNTYLNPEFWRRVSGGEYPELRSRWLEALRNSQVDLDAYEYSGEVNIAVAGGFGNLILIDVEDASRIADDPTKFFTDVGTVVKTGKEHGYHIWVKSDWDKNVAGKNGEIRVNNQYVVAPPSIHPNGTQYEFLNFGLREVSRSFIETDVLEWLGAKEKEKEEPKKEGERERTTTSLWHDLKEAAKELEVSQGKRSDWVFALTLTAKSLLKDEETAFEELMQIPIVRSKVTRDGKWDEDRAYEWWKKYEWDAVGSGSGVTKTTPLYALQWAEKSTGMDFPADYEQLIRDYLTLTGEKGYGHMLTDHEIANELKGFMDSTVVKGDDKEYVPQDYLQFIATKIDGLFHLATPEELDKLMIFDSGIYKGCETYIMQMLQRAWDHSVLRRYKPLTTYKVNEIINALKRRTYLPLSKFYEKKNYINLKNGLLNLDTWELEPHRPDVYFFAQLNAEWDPNAYAVEWDNFLSQVVSEDNAWALQEFAGYCLLQDCRFEKALALVGPGGSGKSTFLDVIEEVLGKNNTANFTIHELEYERFKLPELVGRLVNIRNELPYKKLQKSDIFKQLVSGDTIQVEQKYKQPFMTTLYAKLIFAANQLPSVTDLTSAFFRRWILIPFPNEIKNPDPLLKNKLAEDPQVRNYVLKWMVEGLRRLLSNGFSYTSDPNEIAEYYTELSDSVWIFADEHLVEDADAQIKHSDLYDRYVEFCRKNGYPPVSTQQLSVRLKRILKNAYPRRKKNYRYWVGIRYVESEETEEETEETEETESEVERKPVDYDETVELPEWTPCDVCNTTGGTIVKVTYSDGTITHEHPECLQNNYPEEAKEIGDRKLKETLEQVGEWQDQSQDGESGSADDLSEYELEDLDEEDEEFWRIS